MKGGKGMNRSKGYLFVSSIIGMFLLVYGTSIILRLLTGNELFDGVLSDINYVYLALLCSAPFVLYVLLSGKHSQRAFRVILASGILFKILFVPVYLTLVLEGKEITQEIIARILTIIPLSALLLVIVSHFAMARNDK
jgi:hypothetical protein